MAAKKRTRHWSKKVTDSSNALDLQPKLFAQKDLVSLNAGAFFLPGNDNYHTEAETRS